MATLFSFRVFIFLRLELKPHSLYEHSKRQQTKPVENLLPKKPSSFRMTNMIPYIEGLDIIIFSFYSYLYGL